MTFCLNIIKQNRELPVKPSISDVIRTYLFQKEQKREKKVLIVNTQYLGKNSQCSQKNTYEFFRKHVHVFFEWLYPINPTIYG